jgi:spermidine/putrescine transport system permease protein
MSRFFGTAVSRFFAKLGGIFLMVAVYCLLYTPIIVLFVFSFNNANFPAPWQGFTLEWYQRLWYETYIWQALYNSFVVSLSAVILSCLMGILVIFYTIQRGRVQKILSQFYFNLVFPEIVLAVGLLGLFTFFSIPLGFISLVIAHTVLGLGYVIPLVYARYTELDYRLTEAALDLGASPVQIFFTVILPLLKSSLYGAAVLVFIISFDDFILAYFCAGATFQTLPLYILSMLRSGISPIVNALSTLLFLLSSVLIIVYASFSIKAKVEVVDESL